ncbi:MAG: DUF3667 domain-containing protein [Thermonemataceae bacterium]
MSTVKPKSKKKTENCLNCHYPFQAEENYCPKCGQKNQATPTLLEVIGEFFSNLFSYDSKIYRSIIPFLFRPGFLVNTYIQGKRKCYVHPIRLYIIVSILYFITLATTLSRQEQLEGYGYFMGNNLVAEKEQKADSLALLLRTHDIRDSIVLRYVKSLKATEEKIEEKVKNIKQKAQAGEYKNKGLININSDHLILVREEQVQEPEKLLKILQIPNTFFNRLFAQQNIRLADARLGEVILYFVNKLSLIMFLMIPSLAFIFKLFYIRRNYYYIDHLIHSFHLHTYLFLLFGLALLIAEEWAIYASITIFLVYIYLSFYFVYKQGWFKTLLKLSVVGFTYSIVLLIGIVIGLAVSLLIY